jgi:hypothetical protein
MGRGALRAVSGHEGPLDWHILAQKRDQAALAGVPGIRWRQCIGGSVDGPVRHSGTVRATVSRRVLPGSRGVRRPGGSTAQSQRSSRACVRGAPSIAEEGAPARDAAGTPVRGRAGVAG